MLVLIRLRSVSDCTKVFILFIKDVVHHVVMDSNFSCDRFPPSLVSVVARVRELPLARVEWTNTIPSVSD